MISALQSSSFAAATSATRHAFSAAARRSHAGSAPEYIGRASGAYAACIGAGIATAAFAFLQQRNFGRDALAESPNNNQEDEEINRPLKKATGWVKEVKREGLAKFINETVLGDTDDDISKDQRHNKSPTNTQTNDFFGKIKGAVGDVVENVTDVVENVTNRTDQSNSTKTTDQDGKGTVRTGGEGFASLTKLVSGLILGEDTTSNEEAVRNLIDTARRNVDVGDVDDSASLDEVLALFRELWQYLDKTFAGVALDPTALFYYLERSDEVKNPSWKRMVHRYMKGVDVRVVNELFDALQFAHLAYACKETDVREGLESFNEKYELVYYDPDSSPGEPSHYLALKKGQSRWSNTLDVILSVRGTNNIEDVLTDCLGRPVDYRGGTAHEGFVRSGQHIVDLHKPLLLEMLKMSGKKKIKLRVFGHSLGAATGAIAGIEFNDDDRFDVEVVGFGCPALLSKDLSEQYKGIITTVVNDADMIPRMSGSTLAKAAVAIMKYDYTPKARRDAEQALNELQSNASMLFNKSDVKKAMRFVDKAIDQYIRPNIIQNADSRSPEIEPELFPPGKCIHFYSDGYSVSGSYAPCTYFDELDLARTMLSDHLIKRGYRRLFLELMREYHDDEHFAFDREEFDF